MDEEAEACIALHQTQQAPDLLVTARPGGYELVLHAGGAAGHACHFVSNQPHDSEVARPAPRTRVQLRHALSSGAGRLVLHRIRSRPIIVASLIAAHDPCASQSLLLCDAMSLQGADDVAAGGARRPRPHHRAACRGIVRSCQAPQQARATSCRSDLPQGAVLPGHAAGTSAGTVMRVGPYCRLDKLPMYSGHVRERVHGPDTGR